MAAAHQACDAVAQLAAADHEQVCRLAWAGRLYSPTRTLPEDYDIPHPFTRTPQNRADTLLRSYRHAHQASAQTTAALAAVAQTVRAPSTVLAAVRAATRASGAGLRIDGIVVGALSADQSGAAVELTESAGHFERILAELGETDQIMLQRAAAIYRAGEHLMIESARVTDLRREHQAEI